MKDHLTDQIVPNICIVPVTYRCGCKCATCGIWKNNKSLDPPLTYFEEFFSDSLIQDHLFKLNLTGGEPFLRKDLPQLIEIIIENSLKLKEINISSNGMFPSNLMAHVSAIASRLNNDLKMNIYFSLDGIGMTHNRIRGAADAFGKVMESYFHLKYFIESNHLKSFIDTGFSSTISSHNLHEVSFLQNFYGTIGAKYGFTIANRSDVFVNSEASTDNGWCVKGERVEVMAQTFDRLFLELGNPFYRMTADMLRGATRPIDCFYRTNGLLLDLDGSVYICGTRREFRLGSIRESSISKLWSSNRAFQLRKKVKAVCKNCLSDCYSSDTLQKTLLEQLLSKSNRVILFGAGSFGRQMHDRIVAAGGEIMFFVDNDQKKWGQKICKKSILSPNDMLKRRQNELLVIASQPGRAAIYDQLLNLGMRSSDDFIDPGIFF